ncbi:MAG: hypothetical protein JOZ62_14990 [Acidobacteriaceae bacterium]|nr:hypothetical protein [Acidobacteriaceae bacterium]
MRMQLMPSGPSDISRNSGNETIFKYEMNLLDHIDKIVVSSESKRKDVIAAFKRHNVGSLPDGRKIEDVVRVYRYCYRHVFAS